MATPAEVREALRKLHAVAPEDASNLESYLEEQENQILMHTSEDAFRAFVLVQAQQAGAIQSLLQRIDSSVLSSLAKAEEHRAEEALAEAKGRADKALTAKQLLTQPVALAVIALVSTVLTSILTILLHLAGVAA